MDWEIDRHDWASFGLEWSKVPQILRYLLSVPDYDHKEPSYWRLEDIAVGRGWPPAGAVPVASCVIQGLINATTAGRRHALLLLVQMAPAEAISGTDDAQKLAELRMQILLGLPLFACLLESEDRVIRGSSIDLLSACARFSPEVRDRVRYLLQRVASLDPPFAASALAEIGSWQVFDQEQGRE